MLPVLIGWRNKNSVFRYSKISFDIYLFVLFIISDDSSDFFFEKVEVDQLVIKNDNRSLIVFPIVRNLNFS